MSSRPTARASIGLPLYVAARPCDAMTASPPVRAIAFVTSRVSRSATDSSAATPPETVKGMTAIDLAGGDRAGVVVAFGSSQAAIPITLAAATLAAGHNQGGGRALVKDGPAMEAPAAPFSSATRKTRIGLAMFFTCCSPRSTKAASRSSRTWSRTAAATHAERRWHNAGPRWRCRIRAASRRPLSSRFGRRARRSSGRSAARAAPSRRACAPASSCSMSRV